MHPNDTPESPETIPWDDDPDWQYIVYIIRFEVTRQTLHGYVPINLRAKRADEPFFFQQITRSITANTRKMVAGTPHEHEPWRIERWATIDRHDEADDTVRLMRGLPELEWQEDWPVPVE